MQMPFRRRLVLAAVAVLVVVPALPAKAQDVLGETGTKGAGSTFVYPVLSRWSQEYRSWLARGGDYPVAEGSLDDPPASSASSTSRSDRWQGCCDSRIGPSTSRRPTCR
jgi:hypothetical protein